MVEKQLTVIRLEFAFWLRSVGSSVDNSQQVLDGCTMLPWFPMMSQMQKSGDE